MEKKQLIYGRRNVLEYLKKVSGIPGDSPLAEILVKKGSKGNLLKELESSLPKNVRVKQVSGGYLDKLLPGKNHQGLVCIKKQASSGIQVGDFHEFKEYFQINRGPVLILDRIQDAGNFGSLLRSAECLGFKTVIFPEKESSEVTEDVERISSGAAFHLKFFRITNLKQGIDYLKENGYWIVASTDRGEESMDKLPPAEELALIIGNEKEGVKRLLLENSDFRLRIPLHGKISSLNASVAGGILMDRLINRSISEPIKK